MSQPFLPLSLYFLVHLICKSHSSSFCISLEGILLVCSCTFGMSQKEGSSGSSFVGIKKL